MSQSRVAKDTSKNGVDIVSYIGNFFTVNVNKKKYWLTFKYENRVFPHLPFNYPPRVFFSTGLFLP